VPKVSEALSARIILLKLIVPKAQTLTLVNFSSLYTLGTFYKVAEGLIQLLIVRIRRGEKSGGVL
jgi:hypothetical protein